jgi:hypothetical protein
MSLALAILAVLMLLIGCMGVIGHDVFGSAAFRESPDTGRASRWRCVRLIAVLFSVIFTAKLLLMRDHPMTVPFGDEWDGYGLVLYVPWARCSLSWRVMFSLHNEHRPLIARLLSLALLTANGQWDPRVQQVANAVLHSLVAVFLVVALWIANERQGLEVLVLIAAVTFALPFSWENTLWGFQSAFYFELLFSVLALWLTLRHRVGSWSWFLGWACALCGLFTSAGGVFAPLSIIGVNALKLADDPREWRRSLVGAAAAAGVLVLGIAVAAPPLPGHYFLKAKTLVEFSRAFAHNLAWPWVDDSKLGVFVMWLPVAVLVVTRLARRARTTEMERFILGLAMLVVFNAAAIAYGRGAGGSRPASRYMDFLNLGLIANAASIVGYIGRAPTTPTRRLTWGVLAAWLIFGAIGAGRLAGQALPDLRARRQFGAAYVSNVRKFVITGNKAEFASKRPFYELPYPDAQVLATILTDPYVRQILPWVARQPIHLEPRVVTNNAFVPTGFPIEQGHDALTQMWESNSKENGEARGRFDSEPVPSCRAGNFLKLPVSGYLGPPHHYLAVKDLLSGRERLITPPQVSGNLWGDVLVRCPAGPFAITAIDATGESWFAFGEPIEIAWGSLVVDWLIARSRELFLASLILGVLAARRTRTRKRADMHHSP